MQRRPVIASYVADFLKGDQNHVYRQLTGLRHDLDMHVFTHKRELPDHFPYNEKWLHVLPKPRLRWWRRFLSRSLQKQPWTIFRWELRQWLLDLARIEAQVLHIYFGHVAPQFLPLMQAWRRPVVVSYHGADAGVDMDKPGYRKAQQQVFALAAQVQCRSQALLEDLAALGCPREKLVIQRTGIPLDFWQKHERSAPEDGAWVICQSCRLIEKKGLDLTIRAMVPVLKQWPKARLDICGDGPLKEELQKLAADLGIADSVHFKGFTHGTYMRTALETAHVYVHPSRTTKDGNREGVPNAMLEAMATGLPTIATIHGGIPEAIQSGVNGLLVPENDADALSDAIRQILSDAGLRQRLGSEAADAVRREFSSEAQVASLLGHYKSLMH
jgi:colanic acid/amylovoran biosynthesis glycosyltransferase